jgi:hypothetical protein
MMSKQDNSAARWRDHRGCEQIRDPIGVLEWRNRGVVIDTGGPRPGRRRLYVKRPGERARLVLLSLETGIEIECCKGLTTNCLKNPTAGNVEIEYCKRRARRRVAPAAGP